MKNFVLTMQFDEDFLLPIFIGHYAKYVPLNHIFVIDHGSARNLVPPGVNKIYVPRDRPFSEIDRLNLIKHISAGLLKYYDYGVYADCDELVALEYFSPVKFDDAPVHYVAGFETYFVSDAKDNGKQLMGLISPPMCKPLIFKEVPDWVVGFHLSTNQLPPAKLEIPMAHIRFLFTEEHRKRIITRRKVFQTMQPNEKKAGLDVHWEDGDLTLNNFINYTKYLDEINSIVLPFDGIDRDKILKKVPSLGSAEKDKYFYYPKGRYDLLQERYLLSDKFQDLLAA